MTQGDTRGGTQGDVIVVSSDTRGRFCCVIDASVYRTDRQRCHEGLSNDVKVS